MNTSKSAKHLSMVVFASGIFDAIGGFYFAFLVGTGRSVTNPPTHPFYAILIASFLFSLAYLQFMSAYNIRRYLCNVGAVMITRLFYVVLFLVYFFSVKDFPTTFLPTAIVDLMWSILYTFLILRSDEFSLKDLFLPKRGHNCSIPGKIE